VRGRAGPGEAVQFGSDGGGLGCAGPVEDFPCLAQARDRIDRAASGQGTATQASQRLSFVPGGRDLAGQV
jgi:hypothetical protein